MRIDVINFVSFYKFCLARGRLRITGLFIEHFIFHSLNFN